MKEQTLQALLLQRITEQGPMPFAAYMQLALYHPRLGYYARGEPRTGWAGDFLTSSELDPSFGALWARGFEEIWRGCGSPRSFHVVEIGPGEAGFAESVLGSAGGPFAQALRYRLVERDPYVSERQEKRLSGFPRVAWSGSVVDLPAADAGLVFANEVVDNLPVHLVEKQDGALREVCVSVIDGTLGFVLLPPTNPELARFLERTGTVLPEGHRMEVPLAAESFIARVAATIARGAVVVVDYGDEAQRLTERPRGSLLCYSVTGADDDPLTRPGHKDITSHANWTALRHAGRRAGLGVTGPVPQREVLLSLGAGDLDAHWRDRQEAARAGGRGAALAETFSRRQALRALLDADGLGGLGVMAGVKGIPTPAFLKAKDPPGGAGPLRA